MFKRKRVTNIPPVVQHKWSEKVSDEGFVPFPKRLLRSLSEVFAGRDFEHLQVLLAIVDFNRPNLLHPPSIEYLAFVAGLEEAEFRHRLKQLEESGLVDVISYGEHEVSVTISGVLKKVEELTENRDLEA